MKRKFLYGVVVFVALLFNLSLVSAATFNCKVQGYKLEYDTTGKLVSVYEPNGSKSQRLLSSDFKPKTSAECPTDVKIEIVDNGRTLHIGKVEGYSSGDKNDSGVNNYIDTTEQDNYNLEGLVSCGGLIDNIPTLIPKVVSIIYTVIQIAVPVVLVIMGSLDLFKGLSAQKEDDIKKGQQMFIKRLIAAALVFFAFAVVKIVISFVADETGNKIMNCAECFIENECDE